ncbi:MAG: HD domain-containing phosphohydrolase [Arenicellales bacterium]
MSHRPTYLFNNWRGHGQQVAVLARDIAQELGLSDGEAARVEKAARYHDVGKSRLPNVFDDSEGRPEELSRSERELLMSHTWLGYRILQSWPNPDNWVAEAALLHHEWWNGNGYPLGLARSDIPLVARIVAVADVYSGLLEQRPYASAWHVEDVLTEIKTKAGAQFDPECVDALVVLTRPCEPTILHTRAVANALPN